MDSLAARISNGFDFFLSYGKLAIHNIENIKIWMNAWSLISIQKGIYQSIYPACPRIMPLKTFKFPLLLIDSFLWTTYKHLECLRLWQITMISYLNEDFSACQRHLADFFHSSQIEARCHFYWFDMNKSDNITFYSHNGWIFKVIQAVIVVIWKESELISPVCLGL